MDMRTLLIAMLGCALAAPVFADEAADLSHQYNLAFADFLRAKIRTIKKHSTVEILLKSGAKVRGTFNGYSAYDDTVWFLPEGKHEVLFNLLADDAYGVNDMQDIRLIVIQPV